MKINDKIVINKKLINEEANKNYKTLLGDKGYKEYFFNKTDNLIDIWNKSKIIRIIKLLYSYARLKISNDSEIISVNNGVLQGSLISPLLFDLYINILIIELNKNSYEELAYTDDLVIIVEGRNSLSNILNILEKLSELNDIKVNKNKCSIMLIKGIEEEIEIEGYPVITEYK